MLQSYNIYVLKILIKKLWYEYKNDENYHAYYNVTMLQYIYNTITCE